MARKSPNAPSKMLWSVALIIGTLGVLARFGYVNELSEYHYWLLLTGFGLLAIGTTFRGF